jgi:hypothetical protein
VRSIGDGLPLTGAAASAPRRTPRPARRGVFTLVAPVVLLGLGGVATRWGERIVERVQPGTAGVVRPGTEWNVRSGPSKNDPSVATVAPGQPVRVDCLDRGWARLLEPHSGRSVYSADSTSTPHHPAAPDDR